MPTMGRIQRSSGALIRPAASPVGSCELFKIEYHSLRKRNDELL